MKKFIFVALMSFFGLAYSQQDKSNWMVIPSSNGTKFITSYDILNRANFIVVRCESDNQSNIQVAVITEKINVYNWEFEVFGNVDFDNISTEVKLYPSKNQKALYFDEKNIYFIVKELISKSIMRLKAKTSFKNGYYDFEFQLKGLREVLNQIPCGERFLQ